MGWPKKVSPSQEHRDKIGVALRGVPKNDSHRKALSIASKKRYKDPAAREVTAASLRGVKQSTSRRRAQSRARRAHIVAAPKGCRCGPCYGRPFPTLIESILREKVLAEFPKVIAEKRFGLYSVDAYLPPPYHLAFEADGEYWHRDSKDYDEARDDYLLIEHDLPVVRMAEVELLKFYD